MARKSSSRPVLLIDDSADDLFIMQRLLSRAGIKRTVLTATSGDEAMAILRASMRPETVDLRPCVVFCDIKMPGTGGFEVLRWTREQSNLEDLPFFMLSGSNLESDCSRAKQLGATGYFVKFPHTEKLAETINGACD